MTNFEQNRSVDSYTAPLELAKEELAAEIFAWQDELDKVNEQLTIGDLTEELRLKKLALEEFIDKGTKKLGEMIGGNRS